MLQWKKDLIQRRKQQQQQSKQGIPHDVSSGPYTSMVSPVQHAGDRQLSPSAVKSRGGVFLPSELSPISPVSSSRAPQFAGPGVKLVAADYDKQNGQQNNLNNNNNHNSVARPNPALSLPLNPNRNAEITNMRLETEQFGQEELLNRKLNGGGSSPRSLIEIANKNNNNSAPNNNVSTTTCKMLDIVLVASRDNPDPGENSDSSEELHYGPGIVDRLKHKYLNLTLREANKTVRKAASLEDLLDHKNEADQKNGGGQRYAKKSNSNNAAHKIDRFRNSSRGNDSMKRARSVETLMRYHRLSSPTYDQNDQIILVDRASVKIESPKCAPPPPPPPSKPRRLRPVLADTERPPPDLVKNHMRIFEGTCIRKLKPKGEVAAKVATFRTITAQSQKNLAPKPPIQPKPASLLLKTPTSPTKPPPPPRRHEGGGGVVVESIAQCVSSVVTKFQQFEKAQSPLNSVAKPLKSPPPVPYPRNLPTAITPSPKIPLKCSTPIESATQPDEDELEDPEDDEDECIARKSPLSEESSSPTETFNEMIEVVDCPQTVVAKTKRPDFLYDILPEPPEKPQKSTPTLAELQLGSTESSTESSSRRSDSEDDFPPQNNGNNKAIGAISSLGLKKSTITTVSYSQSNESKTIKCSAGDSVETKVETKVEQPPVLPKQIGIIRPLVSTKTQLPQKNLSDREIEKNMINRVKSIEQPTKVVVSLKSASEIQPPAKGQKGNGDGLWDSKTNWTQINNSMVFNFSNRKDVPDYIENDGLILTRKRDKAPDGIVTNFDAQYMTDDSDTESYFRDPPSPCDVSFLNDNILINGRSNLSRSPRNRKLKIQFDDTATRTFEYPSESSLLEPESTGKGDEADLPSSISPLGCTYNPENETGSTGSSSNSDNISNSIDNHYHQHQNYHTSPSTSSSSPTHGTLPSLLGGGALASYVPSKMNLTDDANYELGVTRATISTLPSPQKPGLDVSGDDRYPGKPAQDPAGTWGQETATMQDMLY